MVQLFDVVLVTIEQVLDRVAPEEKQFILDLLWRLLFLVLVFFLVNYDDLLWDEGCDSSLFYDCLPVYFSEPHVVFYLGWPVQA